jgi:deoxyribonuclease V
MIACLDVDYRAQGACAAAVVFRDWGDASATEKRKVQIAEVQPYEPGQFYRRELPCLLAVLRTLPPIETVIIDGYVWLEGTSKPGLGAHFYEALGRSSVVIGVAKTKFQSADGVREVLRGTSRKPLYVTAVGVPVEIAAKRVQLMHGTHRIPTLLKRVDDLCRRG